jgi:hypothetical protein
VVQNRFGSGPEHPFVKFEIRGRWTTPAPRLPPGDGAALRSSEIRSEWTTSPRSSPTRSSYASSDLEQSVIGFGFPYYAPAGVSGYATATLFGLPLVFHEAAKALGTEGDVILTDLASYMTIHRARMDFSLHVYFDYDAACMRFIDLPHECISSIAGDGMPVDLKLRVRPHHIQLVDQGLHLWAVEVACTQRVSERITDVADVLHFSAHRGTDEAESGRERDLLGEDVSVQHLLPDVIVDQARLDQAIERRLDEGAAEQA